MKKVAVIQSSYIPWKGYFDIIHDVDLFVFYDDVQYTKNDWRNRNRVKTAQGLRWLTIPIGVPRGRRICDVELSDQRWRRKHWETLRQSYAHAPYFEEYRDFFEQVYLDRDWVRLSQLNQQLIGAISSRFLGIKTAFDDSANHDLQGDRVGRLLELLRQVGATAYVTGPSAKEYVDADRFDAAGIEIVYKDYGGYPEYAQLYPPFEHHVSILDLLFHCGPTAPDYIWGWR